MRRDSCSTSLLRFFFHPLIIALKHLDDTAGSGSILSADTTGASHRLHRIFPHNMRIFGTSPTWPERNEKITAIFLASVATM